LRAQRWPLQGQRRHPVPEDRRREAGATRPAARAGAEGPHRGDRAECPRQERRRLVLPRPLLRRDRRRRRRRQRARSRAGPRAAALGCARLRASIDSIDRGFETDSTTLARMIASSQSRKARGRRLTPADQQTFTRDSTARAQAVAQARTARATVVQQMAADSGKLRAAFAPAIEALRDYLTAYPGEADAATSLATLYAQSGRAAEAAAMFDSLAAHARNFDPEELFTAGQRLLGQRLYRAGTRALAV